MQCNKDECMDGDGSEYEDPFIAEGLLSSSSDDGDNPPPQLSQNANLQRLQVVKAWREKLKQALFRAKDRWRQLRVSTGTY